MTSLATWIYEHSPIPVQQLGIAVWGIGWRRRRFGGVFKNLVREFDERSGWSAAQFHAYQEDRLRLLFDAAWGSPYYAKVFREAGITKNMDVRQCMERMPVLSKETLRSRSDDLLVSSKLPKGTMVLKSSGTTGTPVSIYYTPEFHALQLAVPEARTMKIAGVKSGDRRVMFGARRICGFDQNRPPFWRFSPAENMAYASILHLSPASMPSYLAFLRSYRPAVIMGLPHAIYLLARFALEHDDLPAPAQCVITTGETLTDLQRQHMEDAWKCPVHDRYGSVEGAGFISQCERGRYHVSPDVGLVEIVDQDGRPSPPGELGTVVCTGLHNQLQPLIRYRIGDAARWSLDQHCECGRRMPIVNGLEGRTLDVCYTTDGRRLSSFIPVFKSLTNTMQAQVVQMHLDEFVLQVVPTAAFGPKDKERCLESMRELVGDARVSIDLVDEIERGSSGKLRNVVSKVPPEELIGIADR